MALPNLTPGAARRDGGGKAIWPDVPPILIDPASLRPGLDLVWIRAEATPVPVAPGTWCLYLGHRDGMAVVLPSGGEEIVPVAPWWLDEPERLPCDTVDPYDFLDGWAFGRYAQVHEIPVSTKDVGRKPDAYDRGITKGFDDQLEGRAYRPGSWVPYNEEVRRLAETYPEEHHAPELPRRRTLMAVAA